MPQTMEMMTALKQDLIQARLLQLITMQHASSAFREF
jgi:hypothetical protein